MIQNQATSQETLDKLSSALNSGTFVDARRMLNGLSPADAAHLLESSPPKFRHILWQMVDIEREGEVLGELGEELGGQLFRRALDQARPELRQLAAESSCLRAPRNRRGALKMGVHGSILRN